ncbi:MAG: DinB family protein [Longimicrobiales bacterium]|nr:DinB family protein [Longimicrobiales bacterium]
MKDIRTLYAYNRWANLQFLDALSSLSDEELGRDMKSSFPSVSDTLVHLLGAEWVWLERWLGRSPTGFPDASALSSVASVRARWDALWREQKAFLDRGQLTTLLRQLGHAAPSTDLVAYYRTKPQVV